MLVRIHSVLLLPLMLQHCLFVSCSFVEVPDSILPHNDYMSVHRVLAPHDRRNHRHLPFACFCRLFEWPHSLAW
jgi:hypothetical protein